MKTLKSIAIWLLKVIPMLLGFIFVILSVLFSGLAALCTNPKAFFDQIKKIYNDNVNKSS